jgi:hypothetical protein
VLQFEMKFFLEKIYLLNLSRPDDSASKPETLCRLSDDPTPWPDDPALGILESFSCLNECWVGWELRSVF